MLSQIFPTHVANIAELVTILIFFSSVFASPSQVTLYSCNKHDFHYIRQVINEKIKRFGL